jgi:hypothetical protein
MSDHEPQRRARPRRPALLTVTLLLAGFVATAAIVTGVVLLATAATAGNTDLSILGTNVNAAGAGLGAIALGAIIMVFTLKILLKALRGGATKATG